MINPLNSPIDVTERFSTVSPVIYAGGWKIAETTRIAILTKPNWFHRKMVSWILGWKWEDR